MGLSCFACFYSQMSGENPSLNELWDMVSTLRSEARKAKVSRDKLAQALAKEQEKRRELEKKAEEHVTTCLKSEEDEDLNDEDYAICLAEEDEEAVTTEESGEVGVAGKRETETEADRTQTEERRLFS